MPAAKNVELANLLENIADMLEIKGETTFRVRAYRDAARSIESLPEDIREVVKRGGLRKIPHIGESIAAKIMEFLETGRSSYYEELAKEISPGLAEVLAIPGVGPKKAKLFHDKLGIDSVEKLETAAREGQLAGLPGVGEKTEQNILDAIERTRNRPARIPLGIALPSVLPFLDTIRRFPEVVRADFAGSLRRMKDTIGDLDLLAASEQPEAVVEKFVELPMVKAILGRGPTKGSVVAEDGLQIDLRVVKPEEYGAALQYFTGSKAHNIKLRGIAEAQGFKANEYGVFRVSDGTRVAGETEESMYKILSLMYPPPEIREDMGEIEAARENRLPNLIQRADLRGDLHIHTNWSDGRDTPEDIVLAAIERGYEYIAFADHSISMGFVHGLTEERIIEQRKLIEQLNERYPQIRVLAGIEVNIRADGELDYEEAVLAEFDVVTASVHGGMGMPVEKMTQRIIKAIRSPHVDILGHPTGRTISRREPYEIDFEAVLRVADEEQVALEINSQPDRLDLKDTDARQAKLSGVRLAISSDAHSTAQLDFVEYGVATARRGWIEPNDVVNTLPLDELLKWLRRN